MVARSIAIIPARGGSKRLPKKNIIDFMGKPMIAWTIKAAQESGLFNKILVSTDSEEIAEVAMHYGAEVPFLRDMHADDMTPISMATIHALKQIEEYEGDRYEIITQLMPNCPLRKSKAIKSQYDLFLSCNSQNSIISAFHYGMFNPWWAHKKNDDGTYAKIFEREINIRSQDLPELVCPTGAVWITSRELLLKYESYYSPGYQFYLMDWKEAVDIDDLQDLEMARAAFHISYGI